jgi:membrane-associated phospholipid phosphatase
MPWMRRLRPAEWVALAYAAYAVAKLFWHRRFEAIAPLPAHLLSLVAVVVAVRVGRKYFALPWPDADRRRMHLRMAPIFVLVALAGALVAPQEPTGIQAGFARVVLLAVAVWLGLAGSIGVAALLWFLMGIRQKTEKPLIGLIGELVLPMVRDWLPILGLIYAYGISEISGPFFDDQDTRLAGIDRAMFGGTDPVLALQHWVHPALSEWLAGSYVFYAFVFPIVLGGIYVLKEDDAFQEATLVLCIVLGVGYIGYNLVPARGPLFTQAFDVKLDLYYTATVKSNLMDAGRVPRDCFPSLHTGATIAMLIAAWRHIRKIGIAITPLAISIPFACVYLRYHWVIDVVAGFLLAVVAWIAVIAFRRRVTV